MSTSALVLLLLLLLLLPFPFLEPSSSSYPFATPAAADQNYPMQRLPREELVRLAGYGEELLSSVLVTGTLLCQACLHPGFELSISHIKGAKVAVACRADEGSGRRRNYAIGTTDEFGDFMIDLPSQLHAVPKLQDSCVVRVLRLPRSSLCRHLSSVNPRRIELSSVGNGIRVYTGGNIKINLRSGSTNSQEYCFDKNDAI